MNNPGAPFNALKINVLFPQDEGPQTIAVCPFLPFLRHNIIEMNSILLVLLLELCERRLQKESSCCEKTNDISLTYSLFKPLFDGEQSSQPEDMSEKTDRQLNDNDTFS